MIDIGQLLRSMNQIFEAGIAITALSLFIRSLSFRLNDRVSRSFVVVLACIMVIFSGEAINGALNEAETVSFWLTFQWVGIIFLPAAFQHFSDALLETTGRPSRGRRRALVSISYMISVLSFVLLVFGILLGRVTTNGNAFPHPTPTIYSAIFTAYYLVSAVFASLGIWRAYQRTKLRVSRRRITYLFVGAIFLLIGAYPYMLIGSSFAQQFSTIFILLVILGNLGVFLCSSNFMIHLTSSLSRSSRWFRCYWLNTVLRSCFLTSNAGY
ncbi:MAG: histidine kinase N-terminal 7TM domain-containing protein [Anaerolineales bacterium]